LGSTERAADCHIAYLRKHIHLADGYPELHRGLHNHIPDPQGKSPVGVGEVGGV
jgi:hypothetical protein